MDGRGECPVLPIEATQFPGIAVREPSSRVNERQKTGNGKAALNGRNSLIVGGSGGYHGSRTLRSHRIMGFTMLAMGDTVRRVIARYPPR